jgi:hypothetical protein
VLRCQPGDLLRWEAEDTAIMPRPPGHRETTRQTKINLSGIALERGRNVRIVMLMVPG